MSEPASIHPWCEEHNKLPVPGTILARFETEYGSEEWVVARQITIRVRAPEPEPDPPDLGPGWKHARRLGWIARFQTWLRSRVAR